MEGTIGGEEVVVRLARLVGSADVDFQRSVKIELRQGEGGFDRPALVILADSGLPLFHIPGGVGLLAVEEVIEAIEDELVPKAKNESNKKKDKKDNKKKDAGKADKKAEEAKPAEKAAPAKDFDKPLLKPRVSQPAAPKKVAPSSGGIDWSAPVVW